MAKLRGINALYVRFFFRLPLELLVPKRERGRERQREREIEREGDREGDREMERGEGAEYAFFLLPFYVYSFGSTTTIFTGI